MIVSEHGGGPQAFSYLINEADPVMVDLEYFAILRRYQQENLKSYDEDEWPRKVDLIGYKSRYDRDVDYYSPEDYFIELGEWLRDQNIRRRRETTAKKKTIQPPMAAM